MEVELGWIGVKFCCIRLACGEILSISSLPNGRLTKYAYNVRTCVEKFSSASGTVE